MLTAIDDRRARYAGFILLMLSINLIDGLIMRSIADPARRSIMAVGATFDVVAVVSALYYWMLVRPGIRARGSVVAIALAGGLHATYFYPHAMIVRAIVAGLCEAGLIGFVIVQVRRGTRRKLQGESDPVEVIRGALAGVLAARVLVNSITAELSVLYYALFSWRAKPHVAQGAQAFSIHKRVGQADLLAALPIICLLEIGPMHFILRHWSPVAAWVVTGIGLYSIVWLIGLARAFRLRPVLVAPDYVHVRYGLLFQARVPKAMIALVRRAGAGDQRYAVPRKSKPRVSIELCAPIDAEGPFGIRRRVNAIAVTPDDESALEQALAQLMAG
jgi:hypothetical protein